MGQLEPSTIKLDNQRCVPFSSNSTIRKNNPSPAILQNFVQNKKERHF